MGRFAKGKRRYSRSGRGATPWLHVIGAVVVASLLIGAFVLLRQTEDEMAIDRTTLCPNRGPTAMMAILFDLTDPLSSAQANQLRSHLERLIDTAAVGTQFTLGVVSSNPTEWGASAPLCKPRTGSDVSSATQNVRLVQNRYEEAFVQPLNTRIETMIAATGANSSPIMESLQSLVSASPGFVTFTGPRRVILVSDLLQHSDAMSFYRGQDWNDFVASKDFERLGRTLDAAQVTLFEIPRPVGKIRDPSVIEDFWMHYFDIQGADRPVVTRLGDL